MNHSIKSFIMYPRILGKMLTINDLKTSNFVSDMQSIRSKVSVLIIDDEPFVYLNRLRDAHFHICQHSVYEDVYSVAEYPIVICDIKGVGTQINSEKEGAYVAKEIKTTYPYKQVVVYSGNAYKVDSLDLEGIHTIKKDSDFDSWSDYIEEMIKKVTDPKECWIRIRELLLSKEVTTKDISFLEHEYVDIFNNHPEDMKNFPNSRKSVKLGEDVKSIINSMIAGGLLALLGL